MKGRLLHLWEALRASYWFVPSTMTAVAAGLAFAILEVDREVQLRGIDYLGWVYQGGPDGARSLLSALAGSMMTVAGVSFSIMIVALSLASSQFGPRVVLGFMRDTGNQVVLGTFISIFVYCLVVLRRVTSGPEEIFVPHLAVSLGLGLGIASVGVLIYFVHHAAVSIQADDVVATAGAELDAAIRATFPERVEETADHTCGVDDLPEGFEDDARSIAASRTGYVQDVDVDALLEVAVERDLVMHLRYGRGSFLVKDREVARVWPAGRAGGEAAEEVDEAINEACIVASRRFSARDLERGVSQLAEIAVRSLSPGINDPFTAVTVIDRLGASLVLLAEREMPASCRHDEDGAFRVLLTTPTIEHVLSLAFDQVRHYGRHDPVVPVRLLETLSRVGTEVRDPAFRAALRRHVETVHKAARAGLEEDLDRERVEEAYEAARKTLG